ncbi:MAG: triose-phosphate isomerase [Clostridiaceae bacterium]|nr:triose-phosphate isomerase [Clostridiaceae bacterium]
MVRKKIIAGNWKMNKTQQQAKQLIEEICIAVKGSTSDIVICTPFTNLGLAVQLTKNTNISVGAQNMHFEDSGAFTGEVSAEMLTEIGAEYVIIGHSERRQYFGETDETVNKKVITALSKGLIPIVCCGESLEQRENGITNEVVRTQIKIAFNSINVDLAKKVIIAYEPIWAIGTGKTATCEQANEVCSAIRSVIHELYDNDTATACRIQYGGSMNAGNAAQLLSMSDIDGGLIGGASLKAADFAVITNYKP